MADACEMDHVAARGRARRRTLEAKVEEWVLHARGSVGLLDVVQLAEAEAWVKSDAAREVVGYGQDLTDYLDASRRAVREEVRQRRQRTYVAFAVLAAFSIIVTSLGLYAWTRAREASRQAEIAREEGVETRRFLGMAYMDQGRQFAVEGRLPEALPFLVAARELGIESISLKMLFAGAAVPQRGLILVHSGAVYDAAFSPDGTRIVTASC